MSDLSLFLKSNKKERENTFYPATKSLCDENGEPLQWEIKPITTRENNRIRETCRRREPIVGKPGRYNEVFDSSLYTSKLLACSVVFPNLGDAKLQDSYGVKTPEALIEEMLDNTAEYEAFGEFVLNYNGFTDLDEDIEEAKN